MRGRCKALTRVTARSGNNVTDFNIEYTPMGWDNNPIGWDNSPILSLQTSGLCQTHTRDMNIKLCLWARRKHSHLKSNSLPHVSCYKPVGPNNLSVQGLTGHSSNLLLYKTPQPRETLHYRKNFFLRQLQRIRHRKKCVEPPELSIDVTRRRENGSSL